MEKKDLIEYKKKLSVLSEAEKKLRDFYLRKVALGEIKGLRTGYPSIDKPQLKYYNENQIMSDVPKMNAYEYLIKCNIKNMDNVAIEYGPAMITYREMFEKIESAANSLVSMGIKEGDMIASCLPNIPEAIYLIYAAAKIGATIDLIDLMSTKELMAKYCENTKPKILFALEGMCENALENLGTSSYKNLVIVSPIESLKVLKEEKPSERKDLITWHDFTDLGANMKSKWCDYKENMPFVILHTGGTTGVPKGALLSHDNANSLAFQIINSPMEMKVNEKALSLMPPFASYGFGNGVHVHLCAGMHVVLIPDYVPEKIGDQLLQIKPNRIACSPAHYEYMKNHPGLQNADLSFLHHPIEGGDTLDQKTEIAVNEMLLKNGCKDKVAKGYGLTETCSGVCFCVNNEVNKLNSVGIPLQKNIIGIFKIEEENEFGYPEELPYNTTGEIAILSPNNMIGYYNNIEETNAMLKKHADGTVWLHTGDIGRIDEDGVLFIDGRMRRMIIQHSGLKSNPFEVEEQLIKHPLVNRAFVIGTRDLDHNRGELPVAYIQVDETTLSQEEILRQELLDLCQKNVIYYSVPIDFVFVTELPKTNRGKVDPKVVKQNYERIAASRPKIRQRQLKI